MINKRFIIFLSFLFLGLTGFSQSVDAGVITVTTPGTLTTGTVYNITWTAWTASGTPGPYSIRLCRGGSGISCDNSDSINSNAIGNSYSWTIPTSLTTGSDYRINVYGGDTDPDATPGFSGVFTITGSTTLIVPTLTLSANPTQVSSGGSSVLTWSSTNATSCVASTSPSNTQWDGTKEVSSSQTINNIVATTVFSLNCTGPGGSRSQIVTITINGSSSTSCTSSTTCPTGTSCVNGTCSSSTSTTSCDSSSFLQSSSAFDFQFGGNKTGLCGTNQYFKVIIPSGKTCDIKWTLTADSNSDYDLYIKNESSLSRNAYDKRSIEGKGKEDTITQAGLSAGTYYAMVYKETGTGSYSIIAALPNCNLGSTTGTTNTTNTTTNTTATSTTTDTQSQITQLQSQIVQLLAQMSQLQSDLAKIKAVQTGTGLISTNNNTWCYTFTNTIRYKDVGSDVVALKTALKNEGLLNISNPTTFFGLSTQKAVIAFQEKYFSEILTPIRLTKGTGNIGPSTMVKLNQLYGCK